MTLHLADTTFVIDLLRNRGNVEEIRIKYHRQLISLSLISVSEIYTGLYYTKTKMGEKSFQSKLADVQNLLTNFDLLELNKEIMMLAGKMSAERLILGKPIDMVDLIIGATAKNYGVESIISRNSKHFDCWEIQLIDY